MNVECSFERDDAFPYNDGVMLWNMHYMRKTNKEFIQWILSQKNGLYYPGERGERAGGLAGCTGQCPPPRRCAAPFAMASRPPRERCSTGCGMPAPHAFIPVLSSPAGYGPVDQGAFNQFYEKEVKGKPISKVGGWGGWVGGWGAWRCMHRRALAAR